jgi:hypothetical protein
MAASAPKRAARPSVKQQSSRTVVCKNSKVLPNAEEVSASSALQAQSVDQALEGTGLSGEKAKKVKPAKVSKELSTKHQAKQGLRQEKQAKSSDSKKKRRVSDLPDDASDRGKKKSKKRDPLSTKGNTAPKGRSQEKPTAEERIEVRQSGVHGRGVFAIAAIAAGERVIEYKGERISWKEALRRHPHDPNDPNHTFYFSLESGDAIDAKYEGNDARWINHACTPNCEAKEKKGRVFIHARRDIASGEELFYDYGLVIEGKITRKLKKDFACHCGSPECRGTMLATAD